MSDLNVEQQAVVKHRDGARCVLAGPGSGKTKTMVQFFKSLVNTGVPASTIRCVTFSKEAAETIERRAGVKGVFSTLHSLGYQICQDVGFKPVEPELRHRLMSRLTRKWGLDYKELDTFISRMRRSYITPQDAAETGEYGYGHCAAYAEYEKERNEGGWIDFDSMLCDAVKYLEVPQNRARWQFQYLIVDEAQDTDDLQWRMMQLLSEEHGNITVVGDPNQAIYGFRGAMPENITKFEKWFPKGRYYYLGRNYRSTQTIVNFVRRHVPRNCPKELRDQMLAARNTVGVPISLKMYWSEDDEAESAIKLAQADPLNTIIISRTNRFVGMLERICNRHKIRYHLLGKTGFWKQTEIRKAVDQLKKFESRSISMAMGFVMPHLKSRYAVDDRTERDNDALENLQTLEIIAEDFSGTAEFCTYANKMMHRRNDPKGVSISTVHQAKGGEWKNVFIIGAKQGCMPHKNGDILEEERIFFVAISRAIDRLRISFAGTPSQFLDRDLTEEIKDKLREKAAEVDKFECQDMLFNIREAGQK